MSTTVVADAADGVMRFGLTYGRYPDRPRSQPPRAAEDNFNPECAEERFCPRAAGQRVPGGSLASQTG
jgi:hypothetical protein